MLRLSAAAALAATPYAGLSHEMRLWPLHDACNRAGEVQDTVETARSLHESLKCSSGLCGLRAIGTILGLASGKLHAQAAEPSATVETKAARRALAQIIDQIIAQIGSMPSATEAAESHDAQEAIATRIAGLMDDVLASLKGRCTLEAHNAIAAFLIEGVEPELARLAKQAKIFEIAVVPLYSGNVVTIGASFIVTPSFVGLGPDAILFVKPEKAEKAEKAAGAAEPAEPAEPEWVPLTLSTVRPEYAATVGFYRALYDAVSTRPDIVAHIRAILLDVPGIGATPWHRVLSDGAFTMVPLVKVPSEATTGLAVNQLAIVPTAMTPELASAMAAIVASMTKPAAEAAEPSGAFEPNGANGASGASGAFEPTGFSHFSYFTIAPAPPAPSPALLAAVKRKLTGLTGLTGLTSRRGLTGLSGLSESDDHWLSGLADESDDDTDGAPPLAKSAREQTDSAH